MIVEFLEHRGEIREISINNKIRCWRSLIKRNQSLHLHEPGRMRHLDKGSIGTRKALTVGFSALIHSHIAILCCCVLCILLCLTPVDFAVVVGIHWIYYEQCPTPIWSRVLLFQNMITCGFAFSQHRTTIETLTVTDCATLAEYAI